MILLLLLVVLMCSFVRWGVLLLAVVVVVVKTLHGPLPDSVATCRWVPLMGYSPTRWLLGGSPTRSREGTGVTVHDVARVVLEHLASFTLSQSCDMIDKFHPVKPW